MAFDRRKFLKMAGIAALGVAGKPCLDILASEEGAPAPGERAVGKRWAMVIDLKACKSDEGCAKCIAACHEAHNVPRLPNKKHEVKWIWEEPFGNAFPGQVHRFLKEKTRTKPVPIFCNHCDNPPCVRVCPTQATFRRKDGIVMMDFHRCIGCRYCIAACPYGSRSFNWEDPRPYIDKVNPSYPTRTHGVVEKCDFCAERIARGKGPVCVEVCPAKAMIFGDLNDSASAVRKALKENYSIRRKPELGTSPEIYYLV